MTEVPAPARADRSSAWALVAANALPVVGVLFLGWQVGTLVMVYWLENVVIGLFNAARMFLAQGTVNRKGEPVEGLGAAFLKLFMIPFFLVHYGGFCFVHGVFLLSFFPPGGGGPGADPWAVAPLLATQPLFIAAGLALVGSHGYSFVKHYVGEREYEDADLGQLMARPYKRVMVVHFFILGGAFLTAWMGNPLPALLVFVALKVAVDAWSHSKERSRIAAASSNVPARAL